MNRAIISQSPILSLQPYHFDTISVENSSLTKFDMTIRLRLTLWYTALLGVVLILFSVLVYSALATNLRIQAQQNAARQATEVASAVSQQLKRDVLIIRNNAVSVQLSDDELVTLNQPTVQLPDIDLFASSAGVQIVGLDGMIYQRSSNLDQITVPDYRTALEAVRTGQEHGYYTTVNDERLQVYSVPLISYKDVEGDIAEKISGAVQVIQPIGQIENTMNQVGRYLILGTALSLVLAALVGALLARRALAPIASITRTARGITRTNDLGQRLTISDNASEVGQLATTFNEMLDQIQRLFRTQERLVADVSHELRTPLTTIQGNVELLQRMANRPVQGSQAKGAEVLDELLQETLSEVESETARMGKMISDLLLLAQVDSGSLRLPMEPVEMDTLLLEIYRQTRRIADQRKGVGSLDIRLGSEDQAIVVGDRERLRQLLLNLTENAIKYTPAGGTITLGLTNQDGWVQVEIKDTGLGIDMESQENIFERFYRVDKARSREQGGSGLGLSIVQWIAQAHNGYVTVESMPKVGSTFTLLLPEKKER